MDSVDNMDVVDQGRRVRCP